MDVCRREGFKKKEKKVELSTFWSGYFWTSKFLPPQMPDLVATCVFVATTCPMLAMTWFHHRSMSIGSLGVGLRSPKGDSPHIYEKIV